MAAQVAARCQKAASCRFLTLTLAEGEGSLSSRIKRLFECFNQFKRHPKISRLIKGGARCLEVTRGAKGKHWHVHLHCLVEGEYLPQPVVKKAWHEVTGDSFIVDVRAVHDRKIAAKYMAAYVAKPTRMMEWSPLHLQQYAIGIAGVRMLQMWGSWFKTPVSEDQEQDQPGPTTSLCSLNEVERQARAGSVLAARLIDTLVQLDRSFRVGFGINLPVDGLPDASLLPRLHEEARTCLLFINGYDGEPGPALDAAFMALPDDADRPLPMPDFVWPVLPPMDPSPEDVARFEQDAAESE